MVLDDDPRAPICTPCAGGASSHGMWGRSTWKRTRRLRERVPSFALYSRQRTSCAHSQSVGYPWLPAFDSAECRSPVRSGVGCGDHMQPSVGGGTGLTIHHHFTSTPGRWNRKRDDAGDPDRSADALTSAGIRVSCGPFVERTSRTPIPACPRWRLDPSGVARMPHR